MNVQKIGFVSLYRAIYPVTLVKKKGKRLHLTIFNDRFKLYICDVRADGVRG